MKLKTIANRHTNRKNTNLRFERLEDRRLMAVMHVTNVLDNGDDAHPIVGSLREAIVKANSHPGADKIDFQLPGVLVHTIKPLAALPTISDQLTVDGTVGNNPNSHVVVLDGSLSGVASAGLTIKASGSSVRGLVVNNFKSSVGGIMVLADHVVITNNFIGTDASGNVAAPNGAGITMQGDSGFISHNLIASNLGDGIYLGGDSHVVVGNFIGVNSAGTAALSNSVGIDVRGNRNQIGNGIADSRNVISGNITSGVVINGGAKNLVQNNFIGTDVTGSKPIGIQRWGVNLYGHANNNLIGGSHAGLRNVLSGNVENGVNIYGSGTSQNSVSGNFIGVDSTGNAAVPNLYQGVQIYADARHNTIGGTTAGERNIIAGNRLSGVLLSGIGTTQNTVSGNFIGLAAGGTKPIPNNRHGIDLGYGASSNTIGGDSVGKRNVISGNNLDGIYVNGVGVRSNGFALDPVHSHNNEIFGNLIGTDYTGSKAIPNHKDGVELDNGTYGNLVGGGTVQTRNVVSANLEDQVLVHGIGTNENSIQGNYIGTDALGLVAMAKGDSRPSGLVISGGAQANSVGGVIIGTGNVISGNSTGIEITGAGTGANSVDGNFVGIDRTGKAALPNTNGLVIDSGALLNFVGYNRRNIISGNGTGVILIGETTKFNGIAKNYIGTDNDGVAKISNNVGVLIERGAHENLLDANVISGNSQYGVEISDQATVHNRLEHNKIGTNTNGGALGNGRDGVYIDFVANSNFITDNTIAYNKLDGVLIGSEGLDTQGGPYNTISRNSIHDNGKVGIDLGPHDGATPNGNYNSSAASNYMIDHPVLTSVQRYPSGVPGLFVEGTYYSWFDQDITLEFFISPPGSHVQGTQYVGSHVVHATAYKSMNFLTSFPSLNIPSGWVVTATATDAQGNTSEFSLPMTPKVNQVKDKFASPNGNATQAVMTDVKKTHDLAILEMLSQADSTNHVPVDLIKQLALAIA